MIRVWRLLTIAFIAAVLSGCDHKIKQEELESYIAEIKSREVAQIEPLPEVKPYATFTYSALDLRSPFVTPEPEQVLVNLPEDNGIRPDTNRRKETLESYPLDSLRMVGTLQKSKKMWAIIIDTDGTVHRITKGNYVGQNHGRIVKVAEEKLVIKEIVPNPRGGWQEKEATMALTEEQNQAQMQ
jgi:type IV pilus assembly protein PilP